MKNKETNLIAKYEIPQDPIWWNCIESSIRYFYVLPAILKVTTKKGGRPIKGMVFFRTSHNKVGGSMLLNKTQYRVALLILDRIAPRYQTSISPDTFIEWYRRWERSLSHLPEGTDWLKIKSVWLDVIRDISEQLKK